MDVGATGCPGNIIQARVSPRTTQVLPADAPLPTASALRTPISITSSYAAPFAMMGHHEMNGSLTSPSAYASLHNIPPQMSAAAAAAAAAYGRSPMVSFGAVRRPFGSFLGGLGREFRELVEVGLRRGEQLSLGVKPDHSGPQVLPLLPACCCAASLQVDWG